MKVAKEQQAMSATEKILQNAREQLARMTPKQREEMYARQRESFVRAMTARCEHGELDFEQCQECRRATENAEDRSNA